MTRRLSLAFVLLLALQSASKAQFRSDLKHDDLTLSHFFDGGNSALPFDESKFLGVTAPTEPGHKSGFLAAGLSFLIPGLGEYYVGDQVWRGAIFTVLEGGLWYGRMHWIARGDDSTDAFHAYAHEHWSATRYADSLNKILDRIGDTTALHAHINDASDRGSYTEINHAEEVLSQLNQQNFTHRLPPFGDQQYYELISKYIQYTTGWDDNTNGTPEGSQHYQRHADMRATMNHQYEIADNFLYGIILNHVLSAVDAALLAREHNSAIRVDGEVKTTHYRDGTTGYIPTANFRMTF